MISQAIILETIGFASATAVISLPIWAQSSPDPNPTEPSAERASSNTLGGPIRPSKNPFSLQTKGPDVSRVAEDPPAKRFIIKRDDDLTIEVSRFDQNSNPPPAPFFDERRGKNSGLRFFRLKAD